MTPDNTPLLERIPPQNQDAERATLGAMMLAREAIEQAQAILHPGDFYLDSNREVFEAIITLAGRNVPVDIYTLGEELTRRGKLEEVGGLFLLAQLPNNAIESNIVRYASIVRGRAIDRATIKVAYELMERAYSPNADSEEFLGTAAAAIERLQDCGTIADEPITLAEAAEAARDIVLAVRDTGAQAGITTGFDDLDRVIRIIQPCELVIVAARPAMGKTQAMMNLLLHLGGKRAVPCLAFSYEMPREQLGMRAMLNFMRDGIDPFTDAGAEGMLEEMESAVSVLRNVNVKIVDNALITIGRLKAIARRWVRDQRRHGHKLCCIAVDYAQLIPGDPDTRSEQRYEQVGHITRTLKQIAVSLKVPVIALAQLSRACEARSPKRPQLSDLRESGNMEQDADKVIALYRPAYYGEQECGHSAVQYPYVWQSSGYEEQPTRANITELLVLKNRHGATGTALVNWQGQYGFSNLDREQWNQIKDTRGGK